MTPDQLATRIREGHTAELIHDFEADSNVLSRTDSSGVPLIHLLALTRRLAALTSVKTKLTPAILETVWGPGWTVAHTAAQTRDIDSIKDLLQKPEYEHLLAWSDNNGDTPPHIAARHGNLDQLVAFFEDPPLLTQRNNRLQTPVHLAAMNGFLHQIALVLTPQLLVMKEVSDRTVLDLAGSYGCLHQIDSHLMRKARILLGLEPATIADAIEDAGFNPEHILPNP